MFQPFLKGQPITLDQLLTARERHFQRCRDFQSNFPGTIIDYQLNIPGPMKQFPLADLVFAEGLARLFSFLQVKKLTLKGWRRWDELTGSYALLAVSGEAQYIKQWLIELESEDPLARLFDIDVVNSQGSFVSRESLSQPPRSCLICSKAAAYCRVEKNHSAADIIDAVNQVMTDWLSAMIREEIFQSAMWALLSEVSTTPKPGLVDRANQGSHTDMDFDIFLTSIQSLMPFFRQCVILGEKSHLHFPELFQKLRQAGLRAEQVMFQATRGINTHQGSIFSLGMLTAAAARVLQTGTVTDELLINTCRSIATESLADGLSDPGLIRGARREAADGFPSVMQVSLPTYRQAIELGYNPNDAAVRSLLSLLQVVDDKNILRRGSQADLDWLQLQARQIVQSGFDRQMIQNLDQAMIRRGLSPGGSADLLAITLFIADLSKKYDVIDYLKNKKLQVNEPWKSLNQSI